MWEAVGIYQNITQNDAGTCERDPDSVGASGASPGLVPLAKKHSVQNVFLEEALRIPYASFSDKGWELLSQQRARSVDAPKLIRVIPDTAPGACAPRQRPWNTSASTCIGGNCGGWNPRNCGPENSLCWIFGQGLGITIATARTKCGCTKLDQGDPRHCSGRR